MRLPRIALVGLVLLGVACASAPPSAAGAADPAIGAPFTLKPGASAHIAGTDLTVGFDKVAADSRCPEDVQCIQAGEARVAAWVTVAGSPREAVELGTGQREVKGYVLALQSLAPVPSTKRTTRPADYRATLVVTRP